MKIAILVVTLAAGCASGRQQAENELLDCVYKANQDEIHDRITPDEARTLRQGCAALYYMRTEGARRR